MSEQPPQKPQQPTGGPHQPTGQHGTGQPPGQYPPGQPPGQYPPGQPPGQPPKDYDEGCEPPPPPPPPPCPDPCDQEPPWGPPTINPECCPDDRKCCPDTAGPCTWDEVEDPCVRAASAACELTWTILSCKCESSNPDCTCDEWECGGYPDGLCVPCKPCEGLIPEGDKPETGGCDDAAGDECDSNELRRQLDALKKCISSQQGEKAKIDADIKARQEREKELTTLVAAFDDIVKTYRENRHKLICREDCLNGFHRDYTKIFQDPQRFPAGCLDALETAINAELCAVEKAKCCQKNLEGKLRRVSRIVREKEEAERALTKAENAFKAVKDLNKWIGDQFGPLETLRDQIVQALNDADPQKHRWAFYLFYWRFVPQLCKKFPVALCCEKKKDNEQSRQNGDQGGVYLGCKGGDWHPSVITEEILKKLICCAWEYVRGKKQDVQDKTGAVDAVTRNLDFLKTQIPDDKALDTRIRSGIEKVVCAPAASSR